MTDRINVLVRRWLRVYDAQPFIWALALSNLLVFLLGWAWVKNHPLWAVPILAFVALWASLVTGSLFEYLRYRLIRWLQSRGAPPDNEMYLTGSQEERKVG